MSEAGCSICGHPEDDHPFRHAFGGPGSSTKLTVAKTPASPPPDAPRPDVRMNRAVADPILRLALIRAGVLTPEDLLNAEAELKAVAYAQSEHGRVAEP